VEIDEANGLERLVVGEEVARELDRHVIRNAVIDAARLGDGAVDLVGREHTAPEELLETRLEELPARKARDDAGDASLSRELEAQGVDRFEAAVADVRMAAEAVGEDGRHLRGRSEDMLDAEI